MAIFKSVSWKAPIEKAIAAMAVKGYSYISTDLKFSSAPLANTRARLPIRPAATEVVISGILTLDESFYVIGVIFCIC